MEFVKEEKERGNVRNNPLMLWPIIKGRLFPFIRGEDLSMEHCIGKGTSGGSGFFLSQSGIFYY
jgi:hypothetical protein